MLAGSDYSELSTRLHKVGLNVETECHLISNLGRPIQPFVASTLAELAMVSPNLHPLCSSFMSDITKTKIVRSNRRRSSLRRTASACEAELPNSGRTASACEAELPNSGL
jgi:hypothetical protein